VADGLTIHGDLLAIIERAKEAGLSASEAATVKIAEAGRDRMREVLSGGGGGEGRPPGVGPGRGGHLAESVKMFTDYTEVGVHVYVRPTKFTALILDKGWHAHGPVRARGTGSPHRRPFSGVVAEESRAEAVAIGSEEVAIQIRAAGF